MKTKTYAFQTNKNNQTEKKNESKSFLSTLDPSLPMHSILIVGDVVYIQHKILIRASEYQIFIRFNSHNHDSL